MIRAVIATPEKIDQVLVDLQNNGGVILNVIPYHSHAQGSELGGPNANRHDISMSLGANFLVTYKENLFAKNTPREDWAQPKKAGQGI